MLSTLMLAAATMVLPYFEVSVEPGNRNFETRFTITNVSDEPQDARINVWTDRGYPVLWYTTKLGPHASKTISMLDLIVAGKADICGSPGQSVPLIVMAAMGCTLTTGCERIVGTSDLDCQKKVGGRHAHAIGYVTVDAVSSCVDLTAPNVPAYAGQLTGNRALTGTFEQIANGLPFETGSLIDRAGGPPPPFRAPPTPRDPLAKPPAEKCTALPPGPFAW
jgi:hypothetical protein